MKIEVGKLKEGDVFTTLHTLRRGIVLNGTGDRSGTHGGVSVSLGSTPEFQDDITKVLHPEVKVWIE